MKLIKLFVFLIITMQAFVLSAQPVEYQKIQDLITAPDELVSSEFTSAGPNCIFSVELRSEKSLQSIADLFENGAQLNLVSAEVTSRDCWKLFLTNAMADKLAIQKFQEIQTLDWKNQEGKLPIFALSKTAATVTTFPAGPEDLAKNLETAEAAGMKFSGSTPGDNSSSAMFSLLVDEKASKAAPEPAQTDEVAAEFSKSFQLVEKKDLGGATEYRLEAKLKQLFTLFTIPELFERSIQNLSVESMNGDDATFKVKISHVKKNTSRKTQILKAIIQRDGLQWTNDGFNTNVPVITGFETDFGEKLTLTGVSPKSSLIFSQLFPMIQRNPELKNPFFSRGTYKETQTGRVMIFRVDCDW